MKKTIQNEKHHIPSKILPWLLCLLLLTGCAGKQNATRDITILTIGTADSGGSMFPASSALTEAITAQDDTIRFNIRASTGSFENTDGLKNGSMDLALISGDVALAAYEGRGAFSENAFDDLCAIAAVYISMSNWMVLADSPMTFVHDLSGARVAVGPENSASERAAMQILNMDGISQTDITIVNHGLGSGTSLLAGGEVDAMHGFAGLPIPGMETISMEQHCRLLRYTDAELHDILFAEPGYFETITPAGTYRGQSEDIKTFGAKCLLCVRADLDADLVYRLTKTLYEASGELAKEPLLSSFDDPSFAFQNLPVPLHDGTMRFLESLNE